MKPETFTSNKSRLPRVLAYDNPNELFDRVKIMLNCANDRALCIELGVGPTAISHIRHGRKNLSDDILLRIHEATGMAFAELKRIAGFREHEGKIRPFRRRGGNRVRVNAFAVKRPHAILDRAKAVLGCYTDRELAKKLNVSRVRISQIRSRIHGRTVSPDLLLTIHELTDVPVKELLMLKKEAENGK